jgi:hypothetical protein
MGERIKNKINNIRLFNDGKKILKNDTLETLLKNSHTAKMKIEQEKLRVFETCDFNKIQFIISDLEKKIKNTKWKLSKVHTGTSEYNKLTYELDRMNKDIQFYIDNLQLITEKMQIMDDYI